MSRGIGNTEHSKPEILALGLHQKAPLQAFIPSFP